MQLSPAKAPRYVVCSSRAIVITVDDDKVLASFRQLSKRRLRQFDGWPQQGLWLSGRNSTLAQGLRHWKLYYNPYNQYNFTTTTGTIAHLIHPSNTLSAEIDIAAQATVIRKGPDGQTITNNDQLVNCSQYGNSGRNSDPTVSNAFKVTSAYKCSLLFRSAAQSTP